MLSSGRNRGIEAGAMGPQGKRGRPRKRGRRSVEAVRKAELGKEGKLGQVVDVLNECRETSQRQRKDKWRRAKDRQRMEVKSPVVGKEKQLNAPGRHLLSRLEENDPVVYGKLNERMGRKRLEEFVRNAGHKAMGLGRGKRYQGPESEQQMMEVLRGLVKWKGEGRKRKLKRLTEELSAMEKNRSIAEAVLKDKAEEAGQGALAEATKLNERNKWLNVSHRNS